MFKPVEISEEQIKKNFQALPLQLRRKILPKKHLTLEEQIKQRVRESEMTASIVPGHFKSVEGARAYGASRGASPSGLTPPLTNRGGKDSASTQGQYSTYPSYQALDKLQVVPVGKGAKAKFIWIPRPDKGMNARHSFVDWVTFTWKRVNHPLTMPSGHPYLTDKDYVMALSSDLYRIFGFGVRAQRENGMNFYKESYEMGDNAWGYVCIGGQRETVSVTLNGQGLMSAKSGWEKRLYDYLMRIPEARITRIDLASDNFNSKVSLDDYLQMYHAGLFTNKRQQPNVEQAGNWINPNGKGRTLYIGGKNSGKLLRIYEKGRQIANGFHEKYPDWIRTELQLSNIDRIVPFDALLRPGQYLAGAYPALKNLHPLQETIETFKKIADSTLEKCVQVTNHQFGRYIWAIKEFYGIEKAFELLTKDKEELPRALNRVINFNVDRSADEYIHTIKPLTYGDFIPL